MGLLSCGSFIRIASAGPKNAVLEVHATYAGSGKVDESHKFYVALWDSPDFVKDDSVIPIAAMRVHSKSGIAKFEDIEKTPVFVSMGCDATGKWDGQSNPPSGTSLGMYSKEAGVPAPIELQPGKTTTITAEFDDSFQKP